MWSLRTLLQLSCRHICATLRECPKGSLLDPKEIKNVGIYYLKKRNIGLRGEDGAGESSLYSYGGEGESESTCTMGMHGTEGKSR